MRNKKRLFMGLCANAPAALMRGAFLPGLKIMTLTAQDKAFLTESIYHMIKANVLYEVKCAEKVRVLTIKWGVRGKHTVLSVKTLKEV